MKYMLPYIYLLYSHDIIIALYSPDANSTTVFATSTAAGSTTPTPDPSSPLPLNDSQTVTAGGYNASVPDPEVLDALVRCPRGTLIPPRYSGTLPPTSPTPPPTGAPGATGATGPRVSVTARDCCFTGDERTISL